MSGRIRSEAFKSKVMSAVDAAAIVENGWNIGFSGFTGAGYPKVFPPALAERIREAHARGEEFMVSSWTGASTAPEHDGALAEVDGVRARFEGEWVTLPTASDSTVVAAAWWATRMGARSVQVRGDAAPDGFTLLG